jgi:hypothetical protein
MEASKRRKPVPHHEKPASKNKRQQYSRIAQEVVSMILAAAIFTASVWTSVFGAAGVFDQQEVVLMAAGVDQHDQ